MSTSTFSFFGEPLVTPDFTTATITFTFTPPENISGKKCYLQATILNWDNAGGTINNKDQIVLDCNWSQQNCGLIKQSFPDTTLNIPYTRTPVCTFISNTPRPCGPVMIFIPEGPHQVVMTVYRLNNGALTNATTGNYVYTSLTFTPVLFSCEC